MRNRQKLGKQLGCKTREIILELIAENAKITTAQLADCHRYHTKGVEWQITWLKKDGLLRRIGPAKGGRWNSLSYSATISSS